MSYAKLSEFISFVKDNGFLQASHFHVIIGGSPGGELNSRDVMMLCESTTLPGFNIFTDEFRIHGESRSMPYSISYPELTMNFLMDRSMKVRQYFEDWTNQVYNRGTREVGYYSDYVKDMEIYVTDKEGKTVYAVKLYQCYPKNIGDIGLDYNSREIIRMPVSVQYKYWENIYGGNINNRRSTIYDLTGSRIAEQFGLVPGKELISGASSTQVLGIEGIPGTSLTAAGRGISGELPRVANNAATAASASSLPISVTGIMRSLGDFTNNLGSGITSLGQSLANFTAPVAAVSNAVGGIAATLNQFDSVLNTLGIGSPFSGVTGKLNDISGKIAVISNAKGIPGQLGSLGAVMTGTGGTFNQVAKSIESLPQTTRQFNESLAKIGSAFSRRGTDLSNASAQLQSEQENTP